MQHPSGLESESESESESGNVNKPLGSENLIFNAPFHAVSVTFTIRFVVSLSSQSRFGLKTFFISYVCVCVCVRAFFLLNLAKLYVCARPPPRGSASPPTRTKKKKKESWICPCLLLAHLYGQTHFSFKTFF